MILEKVKLHDFDVQLQDFMDSDDRFLMVRGYFDNDKVDAVLGGLERINKKHHSCSRITMMITRLKYIIDPVKEHFGNDAIYNFKDRFTHEDVSYGFDTYLKNFDKPFGLDANVVVYCPVQTVLYDNNLRGFNNFKKKLFNSQSHKNILITSNDYIKQFENGYPLVDRVLILDTTDLNSSNKEKYHNIVKNNKVAGEKVPY